MIHRFIKCLLFGILSLSTLPAQQGDTTPEEASKKGRKKNPAFAKLKGHGIIANNKDGKLVQIVNGHAYGKKEVEAVVAKLAP